MDSQPIDLAGRTIVSATFEYGEWRGNTWEGIAITLALDDGTEVEFGSYTLHDSSSLEVEVRPAASPPT